MIGKAVLVGEDLTAFIASFEAERGEIVFVIIVGAVRGVYDVLVWMECCRLLGTFRWLCWYSVGIWVVSWVACRGGGVWSDLTVLCCFHLRLLHLLLYQAGSLVSGSSPLSVMLLDWLNEGFSSWFPRSASSIGPNCGESWLLQVALLLELGCKEFGHECIDNSSGGLNLVFILLYYNWGGEEIWSKRLKKFPFFGCTESKKGCAESISLF
jgi:hypothetical protein